MVNIRKRGKVYQYQFETAKTMEKAENVRTEENAKNVKTEGKEAEVVDELFLSAK